MARMSTDILTLVGARLKSTYRTDFLLTAYGALDDDGAAMNIRTPRAKRLPNAWVNAAERDRLGLLFWSARALLQEWAELSPRRPRLEQRTRDFLAGTRADSEADKTPGPLTKAPPRPGT